MIWNWFAGRPGSDTLAPQDLAQDPSFFPWGPYLPSTDQEGAERLATLLGNSSQEQRVFGVRNPHRTYEFWVTPTTADLLLQAAPPPTRVIPNRIDRLAVVARLSPLLADIKTFLGQPQPRDIRWYGSISRLGFTRLGNANTPADMSNERTLGLGYLDRREAAEFATVVNEIDRNYHATLVDPGLHHPLLLDPESATDLVIAVESGVASDLLLDSAWDDIAIFADVAASARRDRLAVG